MNASSALRGPDGNSPTNTVANAMAAELADTAEQGLESSQPLASPYGVVSEVRWMSDPGKGKEGKSGAASIVLSVVDGSLPDRSTASPALA